MTWDELFPIVKVQANFAVFRYEVPDRRKDKIQELVCQAFEKYQRDVAAGVELKKISDARFCIGNSIEGVRPPKK